MELTTRGSGPPPTFESLEHNELAPCSFCRLPLQDLGCSHLFCPRCKVFTRAPPVLQWETAGGRKALRAPVGSREARTLWPATHGPSRPAGFYDPLTAGQPNALAFAGCLTPTCSGNPLFQAEPRLTGPRFFPTMWGEPQELPEAPHSASGGHPVGPPRLFPWLGLNHLRRQPGQSFVPLLVRPHWPTSLRTAGPPPPPSTPCQTDQIDPSQPRSHPVSLHKALLAGQQRRQSETRHGGRRARSTNRAKLWAATRKQHTDANEWRTRSCNASFWKRWSPGACHSPIDREVVDSTPHEPAEPPKPGPGSKNGKPYPSDGAWAHQAQNQATRRPSTRGHRRQRRPGPDADTVAQLHGLASLLKCKTANDPDLHSAAIACADWVESQRP